jgi:hypothetical protein
MGAKESVPVTPAVGINPYPADLKRVNPANPVRIPKKVTLPVEQLEIANVYENPLKYIGALKEVDTVDNIKLLPLVTLPDEVTGNPQIDKEIKLLRTTYPIREFKKYLATNFISILTKFLKLYGKGINIDVDICGEPLRVIQGIYFKTKSSEEPNTYVIADSGVDEIERLIKRTLVDKNDLLDFKKKGSDLKSVTIDTSVYDIIDKFMNDRKTEERLNRIKKEFYSCKNQYYIIQVGTFPLISDTGHANAIILDRVNKRAIYIEPQFYGITNEELKTKSEILGKFQKTIIEKILSLLDIPNYETVLPVTAYPQSIAADKNCLYWTFLITVTYLMNLNVKSTDEISKAIIKKYPSKTELVDYIISFTTILFSIVISLNLLKKGARRKTKRRKTKRRPKT